MQIKPAVFGKVKQEAFSSHKAAANCPQHEWKSMFLHFRTRTSIIEVSTNETEHLSQCKSSRDSNIML